MFNPGTKVGVVCDRYGRPSIDAYQTLTGEVLGGSEGSIVVRIDFYNGEWIITTVEDDTLLFINLH